MCEGSGVEGSHRPELVEGRFAEGSVVLSLPKSKKAKQIPHYARDDLDILVGLRIAFKDYLTRFDSR